ncbi:glycosyltransferase family 39 protein [Synechococcus sp. Nb3U1]|uniref:ArnT family glycosyltransferase n=1 Tax=Synechococcus sp. Nb3U1 TaxID=1914529 RepID=UPI001F2A4E83|nr:glycosyltransferase family 39 protein [Synechococcus sp. Nb3U1]MCF2970049.1 glycosyltransferase family 39 protein [Synechococcus sp. Nb3U1]
MRHFENPSNLGASPRLGMGYLPGSSDFMQFRRDPHLLPFLGLSLLIMGLATPLFFLSGADPSLDGCDESFYAQMARELLRGGHWLGPTFLGEPFFEKPPLLTWAVAISFALHGVNEWAARLPGILSALISIPLIGWIGRFFLPVRAAVLGMVALPLCYLWVQQGRLVGQDVPLTCLELIGILALVNGLRGHKAWFWLTGLAFGLGLLMKSAMILLPGAALIPYLVQQRRHWVGSAQFWLASLLGVGVFGLWLGLAVQVYGLEALTTLVGKVQDLGAEPFHADATGLYYFWHIPAHGFPWTILAPLGGVLLVRQKPGPTLLIWSFPLLLLLLLQVYPTKTPYYTVQLYPWLALLAGVTLDQALQMREQPRLTGILSWGLAAVGLLLLGLGVAVMLEVEGLALLQPHAWPLLGTGILYTLLPGIWSWRRVLHYAGRLWMGSLLSAGILTLSTIVLRPDFGNFNPAFAQMDWDQMLPGSQETVVDIGRSGLPDVCQAQAVAFYTPNPGVWVDDQALVQGEHGSHLWVSPVQAGRVSGTESNQVELAALGLQPLAEVEGWQLMRRLGPRPDQPVGPVEESIRDAFFPTL